MGARRVGLLLLLASASIAWAQNDLIDAKIGYIGNRRKCDGSPLDLIDAKIGYIGNLRKCNDSSPVSPEAPLFGEFSLFDNPFGGSNFVIRTKFLQDQERRKCNDSAAPVGGYSLTDNGAVPVPGGNPSALFFYFKNAGNGSGVTITIGNGTIDAPSLACDATQCTGPANLVASVGTGSGTLTIALDPTTGFAKSVKFPVVVNGTFQHLYDYILNSIAPSGTSVCNTDATSPDPISMGTGELVSDYAPDLWLFQRYYASFLNVNGVTSALGTNWMHSFDQKLYVSGNNASVLLFRGRRIRFTQSGGVWQTTSTPRLAYQLVNVTNGYRFLDPGSNLIYSFSSTGDLIKIEDRNGNALTVTPGPNGPTQVSDGLGRTLSFVYTAGKLASVQDQGGRKVSFSYTGNNLTGVTDANGNTTTYSYTSTTNVSGLMTKTVRPGGNSPYSQTYDANGRVIRQTDSLGNVTTLVYNSGGAAGTTILTDPLSRVSKYVYQNLFDVSAYTDAAGQSGSVTYDATRRPTSITDRLGNKTSAAYDKASGYPASATDALGNTTTFAYAAQAQGGFTFYNLTKIGYADGTSASFTYDASGNVLTATDRAGKATVFTYNSRGQVLTSKNAVGGVTTYTYNNDATLATLTSPAGDVTTYSYDDKKRPIKVQFADNTSASFSFDALDQLLTVTDERGKVTKLAYDANTNLKSVTDALNQSASIAYDTDDLVSTQTDALGKATRFKYDAIGSTTAVTNAASETTSLAYDNLDRLKSVADPSGKGPAFTYDAEGRLSTVTDALSNTSKFTVDKLGRTTRISTPLAENTDLTYDAVGRVTATTNPLMQKATYAYDNHDLLTGVSLPGGIAASYGRDDVGSLTSLTDPNGNSWTRTYDNLGRLTSRTDPLGRATTYSYDARNRVSSIASPEGMVAITYDAAGNAIRNLYDDGTDLNFTFDDNNRVTGANGASIGYDAAGRINQSNGLTITRDAAGRMASVQYPPGAVTYSYNSRGLISQVSDWAGGGVTLAYDDAGDLIALTRTNGTAAQFTYDKNRRLSGITETGGGSALLSIALQRDAMGRVTSAGRNLPQSPQVAPGVLPLGFDAADQLAGATYDGVGKLTNDGLRIYTWNLASRLLSYSGADGMASFTYDGFHQRISRTGADGTTRNFVLNYATTLPSVATVQSGGADLRYYIYLPDGSLLYSIEAADNSRHFYSFDEAGSTAMLTADDGSITDAYGITPYGESVTQMGTTDNPFTFQGKWGVMQEAGTSLFYMRYRYYDSALARFLTRDPVRSIDPREVNPYQYVVGNPISRTDPLGLKQEGNQNSAAPDDPCASLRREVTRAAAELEEADEDNAMFLGTVVKTYLPIQVNFGGLYEAQVQAALQDCKGDIDCARAKLKLKPRACPAVIVIPGKTFDPNASPPEPEKKVEVRPVIIG